MSERTAKLNQSVNQSTLSLYSIQINNRTLDVQPPVREKITVETIDKMGDVRKIIGQVSVVYTLYHIEILT